jgi:hypothetical protein
MIGNGSRDSRIIPVGGELPPMDPTPPKPRRRDNSRDRDKPKGERSALGQFQCINAFIDATMAKLPPAERAVWLILWRDTKPNGLARRSQMSIARRAGVSDRSVRSALRRLEGEGLSPSFTEGACALGRRSTASIRSGSNTCSAEVRFRFTAEVHFRSLRKRASASPRRDHNASPCADAQGTQRQKEVAP